jgi:hypothetical protein
MMRETIFIKYILVVRANVLLVRILKKKLEKDALLVIPPFQLMKKEVKLNVMIVGLTRNVMPVMVILLCIMHHNPSGAMVVS